jgi:hypothetical protein
MPSAVYAFLNRSIPSLCGIDPVRKVALLTLVDWILNNNVLNR